MNMVVSSIGRKVIHSKLHVLIPWCVVLTISTLDLEVAEDTTNIKQTGMGIVINPEVDREAGSVITMAPPRVTTIMTGGGKSEWRCYIRGGSLLTLV